MPLTPGSRIGPYEIVAPIGAGGMGEVYKARDPRLDRTVAIKISKQQFTERFEREARAVAALNHPNVCTLYDVGPNYLVMEYVDGAPVKGPLPLEQAIPIAVQIASALDAAHRRGIVHRDLKPANILVTRSGVKLLDFGLAKRSGVKTSEDEATVTEAITTEGSLVGTLQYMAPEVLQGQEADERSDIFSFGCVLYELFAGRRAFQASDSASVIASILKDQPPPMKEFAPLAPELLDHVVRKCLAKDPEERWQSVRDLGSELQWIGLGAAREHGPAAASRSRERWVWAGALLLLALAAGLALWRGGAKPAAERVMQFPLTLTQELQGFSLSPDGDKLLLGLGPPGNTHLEIYYIASGEFRPVTGAENVGGAAWSPDSHSIVIGLAGGQRRKLDLATGLSTVAFEARGNFLASRDGGYLYTSAQGIVRVAPEGGEPKTITKLASGEIFHVPLSSLPDGKFLFYGFRGREAGPIEMGFPDGRQPVEVMKSVSEAYYADEGYLLYLAGETLVAQPFDASRGVLAGPAKPVVDRVATWDADHHSPKISASRNGVMAFVHGSRFPQARLTWVDRSGKNLGTFGDAGDLSNPAFSPDGTRLAVSIRDLQTGDRDIWVLDLVRGSRSRLTFGPGDTFNPVWSPDGSRIAYTARRKQARDLYVRNVSGTGAEELLLASEADKNAESWSPDGNLLAFNRQAGGKTEVWLLSMTDPAHKAAPFHAARNREQSAAFSPDGKFLAYRSNESGRNEVFVQSLGPDGGRWQISTAGGEEPSWRRDGKELYYIAGTDLMAVDVQVKGDAVVAGLPHQLFKVPNVLQRRNRLAATADGQKFLVVIPEQEESGTRINIVVNWPGLLASK